MANSTSQYNNRQRSFRVRSNQLRRTGFTLIELLAVLIVMGIVSSLALYAYRGAQADAFEARTRLTISKIHEAFTQKYEEYLMLPIPLTVTPGMDTKQMGNLRKFAMEMLMQLELPETAEEVDLIETGISVGSFDPYVDELVIEPPAGAKAIKKAIDALNGPTWANVNAKAELLFLIVNQLSVNGSPALEFFRETEFADTDGDGLKEFVDAWGNPIQFNRAGSTTINGASFNTDNVLNPFGDLGVTDNKFPLIYSYGQDGPPPPDGTGLDDDNVTNYDDFGAAL